MADIEQLTSEDAQMPQILPEMASRRQGLLVLCGNRFSGVSRTASALARRLGRDGRRMIYLVSGEGLLEKEIAPTLTALPAERETSPEGRREISGADVVFVEGLFDEARLDRMCSWVEEGRLVIALQSAPAPFVVLRRWFAQLRGEGRAHQVWRLCDALQLCLGQMALPGLGGESVFSHEVVLMTPLLRSALETENIKAAEETLRMGDETSGTVSFNQSLLQLLIRRRIDMRTAFEASRDPADLDQLLKKVGL